MPTSIIINLPTGRSVAYSRIINGQIDRQLLDRHQDLQDVHSVTRFDFTKVQPGYQFPLTVPYSDIGFMGPLSGTQGTVTIHQDGRVEHKVEVMS